MLDGQMVRWFDVRWLDDQFVRSLDGQMARWLDSLMLDGEMV